MTAKDSLGGRAAVKGLCFCLQVIPYLPAPLTLSTLRIHPEEPMHQFFACAKVGLSQAIEGNCKIGEIVLCGVGKNTERAQHGEVQSPRLDAGLSIVHQQHVGRQFCGDGDGLTFAGTENLSNGRKWLTWSLNVQPFRPVRQPCPDEIGRPFLVEFLDDSGWDDHASIQIVQDVDVFDQNEITKWACISDDNHSGRRSPSRSLASSSCRFCQRRALVSPSRSKSSMVYSSGTPCSFRNPSSS